MNHAARGVQRTYLLLQLLQTLAGSFIWGINTLFLLDAGLSNTEAFAANAFFTAGLVLFEIPTGVVADTRGRRMSYLLGTLTLALATLLYLWMWHARASFWPWALASVLLGLGFTFFSGAFEAWLVDALTHHGFFEEGGSLEQVMAKGEIVDGIAMLCGSVAGGVIAQAAGLWVPYVLRSVLLVVTFVVALVAMRDLGFTPARGKRVADEVRTVLRASYAQGLANPKVRWVMLAGPFTGGVMMFAFYAMQPYLLELYGDPHAYAIAGLAAAIVAGAQIAGGLLVPHLGRWFRRRTTVLLLGTVSGALLLLVVGLVPRFWVVITMLVLWGLAYAALTPVRHAYLNALIGSEQRATVLSFDSLLDSAGGVAVQPVLGRVADLWGYPASYLTSAGFQALAVPLLWLARKQRAASDALDAGRIDASRGETG